MCLQIAIFFAIITNYLCACTRVERKSEFSNNLKSIFQLDANTEITDV